MERKLKISSIEELKLAIAKNQNVENIDSIVLNYLNDNGTVFRNNKVIYYINLIDGRLYSIKSKDFKYFLYKITGLKPKTPRISEIIEYIELENYEGQELEIYNFSFYHKDTNILYVPTSNTEILKISGNSVLKVKNGTDNIIFKSSLNNWNYISDLSQDNNDYIKELIESINFDCSNLTKEELNFLLKNYIFSLFFSSIIKTKPILILLGQAGSGKSFFFEVIKKILLGENSSLQSIPKNNDDLNNLLSTNSLVYIDNVDSRISTSFVDKLCIASTGGSHSKRKNYSNNTNLKFEYKCFIGISSRNPKFSRDDLNDRSIILRLKRRENYTSSSIIQNHYIKNRDIIISRLILEFQNILKNIEDYKEYNTNFRISDFVIFIKNTNKENEKQVDKLFDNLIYNQKELTNEEDPFVILLIGAIEKGALSLDKNYKASELHDLFADFSKSNNHIGKYYFNSPKSLGKYLNNNKHSIKETNKIIIDTMKGAGNIILYNFSLIKDSNINIEKEKIYNSF